MTSSPRRRALREGHRYAPAHLCLAICIILALALPSAPLLAQDEDLGFSNRTELSFVATAGNSEATTAGLVNETRYAWPDRSFELRLGGVFADSTNTARTAVGTVDTFELIEDDSSERTAENYFLRGRYERDITERFYAYAGAGWESDEFAGFDSRASAVVGAGRVLWDEEDVRTFQIDAGLTYTTEDPVVEGTDGDDAFLGARITWDLFFRFNDATTYGNEMLLDQNLDQTSDLRADWTHWVAVSMSERLALKVSLRLKYDADPALESVPLVAPSGQPVGTTVFAELDELDSVLSVALVFDY